HHEAIARAFRDHLSQRADLVYSTTIRRAKKDVDPVEDFLFHSRAGHCERFATTLALMLRAEGIPAVLVLGFKGCEHVGEGRYVVRQEHAHAWVEALISRPASGGAEPRARVWHWLSLDPSPVAAAGDAAEGTAGGLIAWGRSAFDRFFFNYTAEQRERAIGAL